MEAVQTTPPLDSLKPFSEKGSKLKDLPSVKVVAQLEVEIPGDWLSMCTMWPDILMTSYIGYWARGVERDDKLGWLLWEFEDDSERCDELLRNSGVSFLEQLDREDEEEFHAAAVKAWRAGEPLPPHYFRLDREAAVRAYLAMLKWPAGKMVEGGINWYENGDASSYDVGVQLALFGEVKYG